MKELKEYIYIDRRRIESYYAQLPLKRGGLMVEKASSWEVSFTLPYFGIKGKDAIHFRDPNLVEKLTVVLENIRKKRYFSTKHKVDWKKYTSFVE